MTPLSSLAMTEYLRNQNELTTKINRIKRDIAHIELIQKCKQTNSYTANQKKNA